MAENNDPINLGGGGGTTSVSESSYKIDVDLQSLKDEIPDFPKYIFYEAVIIITPETLDESQFLRLNKRSTLNMSHKPEWGILSFYYGRTRVPIKVNIPKTKPGVVVNKDPEENSSDKYWSYTFPAGYPIEIIIGTGGYRRVIIKALNPEQLHAHVNAMMAGTNAYFTGSQGGRRRKSNRTKRRKNKGKKKSRRN